MIHTPGPWKDEEDERGDIWVRIPQHDIYIANMEGACGQCLANARLIAAAPDLLEAAEKLVVYRDNNTLNFQLEKADDFIRQLRSAIAKARGQ